MECEMESTVMLTLLEIVKSQPYPDACIDAIPELKLPGDDGWVEAMYNLYKRRAARLSKAGWKFIRRDGPRGIYFEGFHPDGRRIMSEQSKSEEEAVLAMIRHASDM